MLADDELAFHRARPVSSSLICIHTRVRWLFDYRQASRHTVAFSVAPTRYRRVSREISRQPKFYRFFITAGTQNILGNRDDACKCRQMPSGYWSLPRYWFKYAPDVSIVLIFIYITLLWAAKIFSASFTFFRGAFWLYSLRAAFLELQHRKRVREFSPRHGHQRSLSLIADMRHKPL